MEELIKEIEKKINSKDDLVFFLEQIDFVHRLVLKNSSYQVSKNVKDKADPVFFSIFLKLEREGELEKEKILQKKKEIKERLKNILEKEKELEKKIKEIEEREKKAKGKEEKEIELKRWQWEEERIATEKEKWELKESIEKIEKELEKIEREKNKKNLEKIIHFLTLVREYLISLPEVNLEIAFDLPKETVIKINKWFKEKIGKKVILNFKINPAIVGGAIIEYKGKIRDLSLGKVIKKEVYHLTHDGNYKPTIQRMAGKNR